MAHNNTLRPIEDMLSQLRATGILRYRFHQVLRSYTALPGKQLLQRDPTQYETQHPAVGALDRTHARADTTGTWTDGRMRNYGALVGGGARSSPPILFTRLIPPQLDDYLPNDET
ncbi:Hypothetical predicted protein, partial [Pelobates cultripes]